MRQEAQLIVRAQRILDRWLQATAVHSAPLLEEWQRILLERDWSLAFIEQPAGKPIRPSLACILHFAQ